jgi:hypothetical protein
MVISPYDKVQALKFSKEYRRDYEQYVRERGNENDLKVGYSINLSRAGKKLCKKYNLDYPVSPEHDTTEPTADVPVSYNPIDVEIAQANPVITFLVPPEDWVDMKVEV